MTAHERLFDSWPAGWRDLDAADIPMGVLDEAPAKQAILGHQGEVPILGELVHAPARLEAGYDGRFAIVRLRVQDGALYARTDGELTEAGRIGAPPTMSDRRYKAMWDQGLAWLNAAHETLA